MSRIAAASRPVTLPNVFWPLAVAVLFMVAFGALTIGRFDTAPAEVLAILVDNVWPAEHGIGVPEERVVELVRLPRVLLALVAGAGLGVAGAALQSLFRNPLVGPDILGIAPGAAFGGALAIMLSGAAWATVAGAFGSGLAAILLVLLFARAGARANSLTLVLAGVVVGALFSALVSLVTFLADVESELPAILYWLMGSFSSANYAKLTMLATAALVGLLPVMGLRFRLNVMSLGEDEAAALGLRVAPIRWTVLLGTTLVIATSVAVAGVIGWVGLVVPHLARMLVGPDHHALLPASAILGAIALVVVDTLCRSLTAAEIPLSVITAIVGAPLFLILLRRAAGTGWRDA
jgi:iron complex transport system permease protein